MVIASPYVLILTIMTFGMLMAGAIGSYGMVRELNSFPISAVKASSLTIGRSLLYSLYMLKIKSVPVQVWFHFLLQSPPQFLVKL